MTPWRGSPGKVSLRSVIFGLSMSKNYKQLSLEQRYQIESLIKAGQKQNQIAEIIGCSSSAVCRELKRNRPSMGRYAGEYKAVQAHKKTQVRHNLKRKRIKFLDIHKRKIRHWLQKDKLSPELISYEGKLLYGDFISTEWIYQWIWACKRSQQCGNKVYKYLFKHLKHGQRRQKRGRNNENRGLIPNRISIEKRPAVVEKRKRFGDIEADFIIDKNRQAIAVLTDRSTLYTKLRKVHSRKSSHVARVITRTLIPFGSHLKTITFDNDQGFNQHEKIADALNIKTYFTRPYTSQDKGTVENRIWQLRRFIPKQMEFNSISSNWLRSIENKINQRRVRKFNYKTPHQVLSEKIALIT